MVSLLIGLTLLLIECTQIKPMDNYGEVLLTLQTNEIFIPYEQVYSIGRLSYHVQLGRDCFDIT